VESDEANIQKNKILATENTEFTEKVKKILRFAGLPFSLERQPFAFPVISVCSVANCLVYLILMPGCAPSSGDSTNSPGASPEAANTMPSDRPNFILREARLATITVMRPFSFSGS
jgi:hypothetical protein